MLQANPRLRMWQIARLGALVDAGRLDDARTTFEELVGQDGVRMRGQPDVPHPGACTLAEAAAALGDTVRAGVLRQALEPYADRIAVSGLAGISIGPVSRYVGVAAMVSGDLESAPRYLQQAVDEDVRLGSRAHEAQTPCRPRRRPGRPQPPG